MTLLFRFFSILSLFCVCSAHAKPSRLIEDIMAIRDRDDGYISSMDEDTFEEPKELVLVPQPAGYGSVDIRASLFTESLTKEFTQRYQEKLGYTEAEQSVTSPMDLKAYGDTTGYTEEVQRHQQKQREFGEYMFRRLAEFHVDNYFKSEPKLRKIYELKERVSNIDVRVSDTTKINTNYSFSGNFITGTIENPIVNGRVRLEMNPAQLDPGPIEETILTLYRNITQTFAAETHYRLTQQIWSLIGRKSLSEYLQTSVSVSNGFIDLSDRPRETIYLLGLLYLY